MSKQVYYAGLWGKYVNLQVCLCIAFMSWGGGENNFAQARTYVCVCVCVCVCVSVGDFPPPVYSETEGLASRRLEGPDLRTRRDP